MTKSSTPPAPFFRTSERALFSGRIAGTKSRMTLVSDVERGIGADRKPFINHILNIDLPDDRVAQIRLRYDTRIEANTEGDVRFDTEAIITDKRSGKIYRKNANVVSIYTGSINITIDDFYFSIEKLKDLIDETKPSTPPKAKRAYRRASELPDPQKSRFAEVNRLTKAVSVRVDADMERNIDAASRARGLDKSTWLTQLLTMPTLPRFGRAQLESPPKGGQPVQFRLSPEVIAKLDAAAESAATTRSVWLRAFLSSATAEQGHTPSPFLN